MLTWRLYMYCKNDTRLLSTLQRLSTADASRLNTWTVTSIKIYANYIICLSICVQWYDDALTRVLLTILIYQLSHETDVRGVIIIIIHFYYFLSSSSSTNTMLNQSIKYFNSPFVKTAMLFTLLFIKLFNRQRFTISCDFLALLYTHIMSVNFTN
jgi:hypothetical protein